MRFRRVAAATAGLLLAVTATSAGADGTELVQSSERINFNIGCVTTEADPRCQTTQYWLGTNKGNNSVGTLLTVTPAGWALHKESGEYTTNTFSGDASLQPQYVLQGGSEITGQITIRNTPNGTPTAAADSGVFVKLGAFLVDTTKTSGVGKFTPLGETEVVKTLVAPGDNVYRFTFTVPAELDGVAVTRPSAEVGQRHIGAGYGFMDGRGGSYLDLPHLVEAEPAA
jgi:hypothetical protein